MTFFQKLKALESQGFSELENLEGYQCHQKDQPSSEVKILVDEDAPVNWNSDDEKSSYEERNLQVSIKEVDGKHTPENSKMSPFNKCIQGECSNQPERPVLPSNFKTRVIIHDQMPGENTGNRFGKVIVLPDSIDDLLIIAGTK